MASPIDCLRVTFEDDNSERRGLKVDFPIYRWEISKEFFWAFQITRPYGARLPKNNNPQTLLKIHVNERKPKKHDYIVLTLRFRGWLVVWTSGTAWNS